MLLNSKKRRLKPCRQKLLSRFTETCSDLEIRIIREVHFKIREQLDFFNMFVLRLTFVLVHSSHPGVRPLESPEMS
ncbi:hypothetical protein L596_014214 [Steinernema carpocapsae]|uniref:Uncharacterized protein n=1 Tax=Steinernema carpocapsae TaxID=34508 RepID=A0A4V6A2P2_STECR|nr:hypothetical protein L596_014214 [Steinernema carpocapsae]